MGKTTVSVNRSESDSENENVAVPVSGSYARPEKRRAPTSVKSTRLPPSLCSPTLHIMDPAQCRARFRAGLRRPTAGLAPGYTQANLIAVPAELAPDLRRFAELNPKPCPLLDVTEPGSVGTRLASNADLRTDLPAYRIWRDGECVAEVTDASEYWRDDLVAFLIGCSFTF